MAIIKTAMNIDIIVANKDTVISSGKYSQRAETVIMESIEKNIRLSSAKKVCSTGNIE